MTDSLYNRIGGKAAIDAAVDIFYEKVLADDRVNGFFDGIDIDRQRGKQRIFLAYAFGGAVTYEGKDLRECHRHLIEQGLSDEHFNATAEHLQATLEQLGVDGELVGEVLALVGTTRNDVLDRPAAEAA